MTGKTPLECHATRMHLSLETHGKTHRLPVAVFLGFQPEFQLQNIPKTFHNTSIQHLWTQTCQNTLHYITYSPILIKLQLNTSITQFQEKFTTKYNHTPFNLAQSIHSSKPITLEVICYLPQQHLTHQHIQNLSLNSSYWNSWLKPWKLAWKLDWEAL